MVSYLAVLTSDGGAIWHAFLPDFPGCRGEATNAESAARAAVTLAREQLRPLNGDVVEWPGPRDIGEIRADPSWARERNIDWNDAIFMMVDV